MREGSQLPSWPPFGGCRSLLGVLLQGRFSGHGPGRGDRSGWYPGAPGLCGQTAPCLGRGSQPPPGPALTVDTALELRTPCPSAPLPRLRSQLTSYQVGGRPGSAVPHCHHHLIPRAVGSHGRPIPWTAHQTLLLLLGLVLGRYLRVPRTLACVVIRAG